MVMMIARTGREKQRYENGCRLIAGCVPYKLSEYKSDGSCVESRLQILVVKAQKSEKVLLPKGGWENDETVEEAALREAMEEAGVDGKMGNKLGVWTFSSKGHEGGDHVAHMFPLEVSKLLDAWPEEHLRERLWMSADGARNHFKHQWMREALDKLINVLSATYEQKPLLRSTMAVDKVSANSEQKVQIQFTKTVDKLTNEATCQQKSQPRWMRGALDILTNKVSQKQLQVASECLVNQNFGANKLHIRVWHQPIMCLLFEKRTKYMWVAPRFFRLFMFLTKEREHPFACGVGAVPRLHGDQKPEWSNGLGPYPSDFRADTLVS